MRHSGNLDASENTQRTDNKHMQIGQKFKNVAPCGFLGQTGWLFNGQMSLVNDWSTGLQFRGLDQVQASEPARRQVLARVDGLAVWE